MAIQQHTGGVERGGVGVDEEGKGAEEGDEGDDEAVEELVDAEVVCQLHTDIHILILTS